MPVQKGTLAFATVDGYKFSLHYYCETGDLPNVINLAESPSSLRAAFTTALYMQG